jgi:hypothetical protein
MGAGLRLAAFAGLLALVSAVAAVAGDRVDWTPRAGDDEPATHGGEGGAVADDHGGKATAADHGADVAGLAVSEGGLTLALDRTRLERGRTGELSFRVVGAGGATVRDFDVEHTKRMHLIVVRRDLTGFQHLHPTQDRDGRWRVALRVDDPGAYRVFADFTRNGERHTLGADLTVDGAARTRPLPAPATTTTVDGYRVSLDASHDGELRFAVTRDGKPVAVEPYLGARGHLVALREGDLAYLHVHPDEDSLAFMAELPRGARYRLFLQFQHEGRVHTAEFTKEIPA